MPTATLTSKGQTTIPKEIRERLNLKPGDRIEFVVEDGGRVVLRPRNRSLDDLVGMLKPRDGRRASIEEMNEAIQEGAVARFKRSCE